MVTQTCLADFRRHLLTTRHLLVLMVVATVSSTAFADDAHRGGTMSVMIENDMFAGRDGHYTNGFGLVWVPAREASTPEWARQIYSLAPWFPDEGTLRHGYVFGQSMFTPKDIENPDPPSNERPYAGWLYGTFGIAKDHIHQLDIFAVTLGVVGPASLAGRSQKLAHRLTGSAQPQGWSTQMHNEPGLVLTAQRSWRNVAREHIGGLSFDVLPYVGGALGNVFTYANGGTAIRLGNHLPADFGVPRIQPALFGGGEYSPTSTLGWYLFAGLEGRAVARNIFLDGNTFQNSRGVDRTPWVGDIQYGLVVNVRSVQISFTSILRSREYRTQDKPDRFGALTVSIKLE